MLLARGSWLVATRHDNSPAGIPGMNEKGIMMTDKVSYKIPFGFLGSIAQALFVKKQLKGIFEYRVNVLEEKFGKS